MGVLAVSWLGAIFPAADNLNIAAIFWWPLLAAGVLVASSVLRHRNALWLGLAVFAVAVATGVVLFRPMLHHEPSIIGATQQLTMIEYNMFKWNTQSEADAEWLAAQDADILVLLEASRMQKWWGAALQRKYPTIVSCSAYYKCSTVLFSKYPLVASQSLAADGDADNRKALSALTATLDVNGTPLTVLLSHLDRPWPMGEQEQWIEPLGDAAKDIEGTAIWAGDFNSAPWTHAIRSMTGPAGFRLASGLTTSWPAENPSFLRLPLDQIYLRGPVRIDAIETGPRRGSDHLPLLVTLELPGGKAAAQ